MSRWNNSMVTVAVTLILILKITLINGQEDCTTLVEKCSDAKPCCDYTDIAVKPTPETKKELTASCAADEELAKDIFDDKNVTFCGFHQLITKKIFFMNLFDSKAKKILKKGTLKENFEKYRLNHLGKIKRIENKKKSS